MAYSTSGGSSVERFARDIANLKSEVRALATTPQLPYSSVEGGGIDFNDANGGAGARIGMLPDGTRGVIVTGGPTPPQVTGLDVGRIVGGLIVFWDGTWGTLSGVGPLDFSCVEIHISTEGPDFLPELVGSGSSTLKGVFPSIRGGSFTITGLTTGTPYWVKLVGRSLSGKWGPSSPTYGPMTPGEVTSEDIVITPPTVSPTITSVNGMPNALVVVTQPVRPEDQLEYHISMAEGFVPTAGDPATLALGPTGTTVGTINKMPDGSPLLPGQSYSVAVIATNASGSAAPSPAVDGRLDASAVETLVAQQMVAGFVLAGQIRVGNITIDPDGGIVIPQPGGGVIRFPTSGTDFAEITAHMVAKTLTVEGNMTISGAAQLRGKMKLQNGVTGPTAGPTMSNYWPTLQTGLDYSSFGDIYTGMSNRQFTTAEGGPAGVLDPNSVVVVASFYGPSIAIVNKSTGAVYGGFDLSSWSSLVPVGGITLIGQYYYVLGHDLNRGSKFYVYVLNRDFQKVGEMYCFLYTTIAGRPTIGRTQDGRIIGAWVLADTRHVEVKWYSVGAPGSWTLDAQVTAWGTENPGGAPATQEFSGIHFGKQDRGSGANDRIYLSVGGMKKVFAYYTSSGRMYKDTALSFDASGSASYNKGGMLFDITDPLRGVGRFLTLDSSGRLTRYSGFQEPVTWAAQSTFADLDPGGTGLHETPPSPTSLFTQQARAWVRVTSQPAPDAESYDPANLDKANRVAIYMSTSPAAPQLQAIPPAGQRTIEVDWLAGGATAPSIGPSFTGAAYEPGQIESTAVDGFGSPVARINGAGEWRLGDLYGNAFGTSWHQADTSGYVFLASTLVGDGIYYRIRYGWVNMIGNGTINMADAAFTTIFNAGGLPAQIRPQMLQRTGCWLSQYPGIISILPDGTMNVINRTGALRNSLSFSITYPLA